MLDLALPESAEVIGHAALLGRPRASWIMRAVSCRSESCRHVSGCGKHFPGLGGGTLDSHWKRRRSNVPGRQMWNEDLEPYRALHAELPMVMMNHAAYPLTPDKKRPASVSNFWIAKCCASGSAIAGSFFPTIWRWAAF